MSAVREVSDSPFAATRISLQAGERSLSLLGLSRNELVDGKVLKSLSPEKALLSIKGSIVTAKTSVPLKQGGILSLKVQEESPVPILKLLGIKSGDSNAPNIPALFSAIEENLWKSVYDALGQDGQPKETSSHLRALMSDLSMRLFLRQSPALLGEFIDMSGITWEAKLRKRLITRSTGGDDVIKMLKEDVKGLASQLLALKPEKADLLERLVSTIDNIQLLNHRMLRQSGQIFLPIPLQFPDGLFSVGQLLIQLPENKSDRQGREKKEKDRYSITFLLELSHLGRLRADLTVRGKEIQGKFLLTQKEAKLLIERSIPLFVTKMQEKGFFFTFMECQLKEPEAVQQTLMSTIIHDMENTINLVI